MYKIIFLDIDGTILSSEHKILPGTITAVQRINMSHIPVVLISARPPAAIKSIYSDLQLNTPVVCLNGALLVNNMVEENFEVLYSSSIDVSLVVDILAFISAYDISINFYQNGEWLTNIRNEWVVIEERITNTHAVLIETDLYLKETEYQKNGIQKILLIGHPDTINILSELLKIKFSEQLNIHKSKDNYLEIINRDASKIFAIQFLLNKFNLNREQVLAVGDNFNDIEMLKFAGMGIAMGNAPEAVKKIARFVTLDNNSEGIKFAFDKFIR